LENQGVWAPTLPILGDSSATRVTVAGITTRTERFTRQAKFPSPWEPIQHSSVDDLPAFVPPPDVAGPHEARQAIAACRASFSKFTHHITLEQIRSRGIFLSRVSVSPDQELHMNWDRIEGNWKSVKGKAQQQWGKLTNDDLDVIEGKRVELSGKLQNRYGIAKDEAERQIDSWLKTIN
jgi:uncharacterized protein YjbJ (UPF0337 family)